MWTYDKKLQYPVKIKTPNPALAKFIITQYGGPDGEIGASLRYLSQRYTMPYREAIGILNDIGTEVSKWPFVKIGIFAANDKAPSIAPAGTNNVRCFTLIYFIFL